MPQTPRVSRALTLAVLATVATAGPSVANLTVEYLVNPAAIDITYNPSPRFAWQLSGALQASYHLIVSVSATGAVVWDSGVVASSRSTQVPYGGVALLTDADFDVGLLVVFADGSSAPSVSATFGTGPDAVAWAASAVWLGGCTAAQASPQLRRSFHLASQPILRAKAFATGLGIYALYLNGGRVGGGMDVLTPGWSTVPTARVLANGYDVSAALTAGAENVVGMRLGQGKYGYAFEFCAAGDASCYAALLHLSITQRAPDGSDNVTVLSTAATGWECAPSPIVFNHLFDGETYDDSLEQRGWASPGFMPASPWLPARPLAPPPVVSQVTTAGAPIRIVANVTPISVVARASGGPPIVRGGAFLKSNDTSDPDVFWVGSNSGVKNHLAVCEPCAGLNACADIQFVSHTVLDALVARDNFTCEMLPQDNSTTYVFDLARNMAGFCSLSLPPAPAGTVLTLAHGEILDGAGALRNTFGASAPPRSCSVNQINCADQMDVFVYANDTAAGEAWTPTMTFHGFRYVGLFGWPPTAPAPSVTSLTCHQAHSDMEVSGSLVFNNTALNQIQAAIVQTQRSNLFSIPSDCPTREKRGWMGDAQAAAPQALQNLRIGPFYENWLRTFGDTSLMGCEHTSEEALSATSPLGGAPPPPPPRPAGYLCCDARKEFGCQPGLTPTNATGSLPGETGH